MFNWVKTQYGIHPQLSISCQGDICIYSVHFFLDTALGQLWPWWQVSTKLHLWMFCLQEFLQFLVALTVPGLDKEMLYTDNIYSWAMRWYHTCDILRSGVKLSIFCLFLWPPAKEAESPAKKKNPMLTFPPTYHFMVYHYENPRYFYMD